LDGGGSIPSWSVRRSTGGLTESRWSITLRSPTQRAGIQIRQARNIVRSSDGGGGAQPNVTFNLRTNGMLAVLRKVSCDPRPRSSMPTPQPLVVQVLDSATLSPAKW
jgi:hypothetical protein